MSLTSSRKCILLNQKPNLKYIFLGYGGGRGSVVGGGRGLE